MIIESNVIRYPGTSFTRLTLQFGSSGDLPEVFDEPQANNLQQTVEIPNASEYIGALLLSLRDGVEGVASFSRVPSGGKGSGECVDLTDSFERIVESNVISYPHLDNLTDDEILFCIQFLCDQREVEAPSFDQLIDEHQKTTFAAYRPLAIIIVADTLGRDNFSKLLVKALDDGGRDSKLAWSILTKCLEDVDIDTHERKFLLQRARFLYFWTPLPIEGKSSVASV